MRNGTVFFQLFFFFFLSHKFEFIFSSLRSASGASTYSVSESWFLSTPFFPNWSLLHSPSFTLTLSNLLLSPPSSPSVAISSVHSEGGGVVVGFLVTCSSEVCARQSSLVLRRELLRGEVKRRLEEVGVGSDGIWTISMVLNGWFFFSFFVLFLTLFSV